MTVNHPADGYNYGDAEARIDDLIEELEQADAEIDRLRTALAEIRETAKLWHGELLGCRTALAAACTEREAALARVHDVTEAARAIVQRWDRLGGMIGPDVERLWDALAALDRHVGDPVPGAPGGGEGDATRKR